MSPSPPRFTKAKTGTKRSKTISVCEGEVFSEEKPPPSRSLPKRRGKDETGGRGRFSERRASPPRPLSPEERLAFDGVLFFWLGSACESGVSPIGLRKVTAADRAAAPCQQEERTRWLLPHSMRKAPTAVKLLEPFHMRPPHAACPRRLCQPPWTHTTRREPRPPRMGAQVSRKNQAYSQLLFGRGGLGERRFS